MSIEEIRQHRVEAEKQIYQIMDEFQVATGMSIIGCDVATALRQAIGQLKPEIITTGVTLEIEPI